MTHHMSGQGDRNPEWLLASWRMLRGWSVREAGEGAGLSASYVSRVERGLHRPSPESVAKLLAAYTRGTAAPVASAVERVTRAAFAGDGESRNVKLWDRTATLLILGGGPRCVEAWARVWGAWQLVDSGAQGFSISGGIEEWLSWAWLWLIEADCPPEAARAVQMLLDTPLALDGEEETRSRQLVDALQAAQPLVGAEPEQPLEELKRIAAGLPVHWQLTLVSWARDLVRLVGLPPS